MFYDKKKSVYFIGGLLAGGLLGSLAGLLFAPKSGKELRKNISDKGNEIIEDTNVLIESAKEKAAGIISDAKHKAGQIIEDSKTKLGSFIESAENLAVNGKDKVEEGVSKVRSVFRSTADALLEERSKMNTGSPEYNSGKAATTHEEKSKYNRSKV